MELHGYIAGMLLFKTIKGRYLLPWSRDKEQLSLSRHSSVLKLALAILYKSK